MELVMKRISVIAALALSAILGVSCSEQDSGIERWGEIKSYPDWWLNPYHPETITRTLNVEFNEDAKADFQRDVVLALYQVDEKGREVAVRPDDVKVFVNGVESPDNTLRIGKNDERIDIGLQIQKSYLEQYGPGMFNWKFKVIDNGGLDYINEFEVSGSDETPLLQDNTAMDVYHERGKNVPRVITDTTLITLLLALLAIIILIQIFVPKFTEHQIKKQFITIDGDRKGMPSKNKEAKGSARIVLTGDKRKKQSFINRLFNGKSTYLFIKGLPSDITLTPGKMFQTLAEFDKKLKLYSTTTIGDHSELKVIKGETTNGETIEIEFYAKKK